MSKSSREARLRSRPTGKSSFGAKNFAGKTFGRKKCVKSKKETDFRVGKMAGVSSSFWKSKGGKSFGGNKGERFLGKK